MRITPARLTLRVVAVGSMIFGALAAGRAVGRLLQVLLPPFAFPAILPGAAVQLATGLGLMVVGWAIAGLATSKT
ncbi:MAG: hypothetical protein KatS3mg011_0983 [Acidimicrobiia bacterium]|nr:MAG: hypothetical protein KatS3mg011_0983 [Acidimicrobiia bacterium]